MAALTLHDHPLSSYCHKVLIAHPSVARAFDAARPWFRYDPGRAGLSRRFFDPDSD